MQKDEGASVRIYNLAKSLAVSGNSVTVVLPRDKATTESVQGVTVHSFRGVMPRAMLEVLRRLVNVTRPTSLYFYDFLFAFRICKVVREADVVQMEHPSSTGLLILFIKKILKMPVVVDCHDVFQALRLQHTSTLRRMLETFVEKLAYKNADLVLTVSEIEKDRLISTGFQKCKIEVVPNGVDTRFFVKSPERTETRKKYALEGFRIVIFVGNLEYSPNLEAVQTLSSVIIPRVVEEIKDVKFVVVGKSQDKLELPRLMFTGFVDNVSEILSISEVAVAPLFHGSGTRLKILEYFSCGLPVVSTSIGAEGLDIKDGVNIFIEDDLYGFALRIIELLRNKKLSISMGEAARLLVTRTYDWTQITRKLEMALSHLLSEQFHEGLSAQASTTHISA
jgi:glycosyltransferase involved in cell wall biosynthesis